MDEKERKKTEASLLKDMEATAASLRKLIVGMPPRELLGYIYAKRLINATADQSVDGEGRTESDDPKDLIDQIQFLLEYVHAVLASDAAPEDLKFDETTCAELFELSRKLRDQAMFFAIASSTGTKTGVFDPDMAHIEIQAKVNWVTVRGNRYDVLEGEFYSYVLAPHDDVLNEVYGVGADEIAEGFQAMANTIRSGHVNAFSVANKQLQSAQTFADTHNKPLADIIEVWGANNPEQREAVGRAYDDMFLGGVANVSRHTKLPSVLLADLAYTRGAETEFFAAGVFSGTPYRTLPARKKPLIQLGHDYYAVDPCSARDAGYRALLFNLLERKPEYMKTFKDRQKVMSESAFADILSDQLPDAQVFQGFYCKAGHNQWPENDTLILIDDVLILVEAKSGANATIASPELDFDRHIQSVEDLVLKAYKQCDRFFRYLNSAEEVPLYELTDGKYKECGSVRRSDYRVMVPIGLTVESFAPLSASCKELAQVKPLLGKHAFISLSIDDLFVLKRFLPTPGSFAHYLEVRQSVAGIRCANLFDEFDHLGAYLTGNRFDFDLTEQLNGGKADMVVWNGMSEIVDKCFALENWETQVFPAPRIPDEVLKLLDALDTSRAKGWLSAESYIRNLKGEGNSNLAAMLIEHRETLTERPFRYLVSDCDGDLLFVWLQQYNHPVDWTQVDSTASAAALAYNAKSVIGIFAKVSANGAYRQAKPISVEIPTSKTSENEHVYEEATRMAQHARAFKPKPSRNTARPVRTKKLRRNDICFCGSGLKYKRCHGR